MPAELPIVPVYLRIVTEGARVLYHVTECRFPDPRAGMPVLDSLEPVGHRCLALQLE